jgi:hypothetical protein
VLTPTIDEVSTPSVFRILYQPRVLVEGMKG